MALAYVEAIHQTLIRLRTWDEKRPIFTVQHFISNPFDNWPMTDAKVAQTLTLVLDHDVRVEAVRSRFHALVDDDPDALSAGAHGLQVIDHDARGIHLRRHATAADPPSLCALHMRLRERLLAWVRQAQSELWPRERIDHAAGDESRSRLGVVSVAP